ncbi:MAG: bifunctional aminotransferase class I/II-fold pyridoxal phosphate-dependent enzyme/GNAT family N-acetyltransferase [Myxococcaceae bacterium]
MESSEFLDTVYDVLNTGRQNRAMFQYADDLPADGKNIMVDGERLLSFGSCSYLGLETDPRLKEGVIKAVERFGTQFSCSRGYVSTPLYKNVEEQISELFGAPTLATPTTTLGHLAAIPVLVNEHDAIILDHQVHASVQMGATQARAAGATLEVIRHGDLGRLEELVDTLVKKKRHVWHMVDGVYSMYGDLPDADLLTRLLEKYEQFHLYVDDAHGMSVDGKHGRGVHFARMPHHPRMIVATSFAKAFAAGGGCIVFPTDELRQRVRMCGSPLTFGGPLQPPMLGAILANTSIHLSPEIETLKAELRARIDHLNELLIARDLPLLARNHGPIFFLRTGPLRLAWNIAARLRRQGIYVNVSAYPTVPMKRSGIRLSVTRHHDFAELERLSNVLAEQWPLALAEEGLTQDEVDSNFINNFEDAQKRRLRELFGDVKSRTRQSAASRTRGPWAVPEGLELQHVESIEALDAAEWDRLLGDRGTFSASALAMLERTFRDRPERENNWKFHYFVVRHDGRPIAATFFTEALWKDDMLMRSEISRKVEELRRDDPYYLTSRLLVMGSLLSEGNHLYLDREARWKEALAWILDEADKVVQQRELSGMVVRDLPDGDAELDAFLLDTGLVKVPMLTSFDLKVDEWKTDEEYLARLGRSARKTLREEVLEREGQWQFRLLGVGHEQPTGEELAHMHRLYLNVKARKVRLNTFDLPDTTLGEICRTPGWEIVALHLPEAAGGPADGRAVGFVAGFKGSGSRYTAMVCGIDYDFQKKHVYRQILWQAIRRTRAHGYTSLGLGVDAEVEKQRLGATAHGQCVYLQATDHFGGAVMRQIVQEEALNKKSA